MLFDLEKKNEKIKYLEKKCNEDENKVNSLRNEIKKTDKFLREKENENDELKNIIDKILSEKEEEINEIKRGFENSKHHHVLNSKKKK